MNKIDELTKQPDRRAFLKYLLGGAAIGIPAMTLLQGCGMPNDPIDTIYSKDLLAGIKDTYNVGSETYRYKEGHFKKLVINGVEYTGAGGASAFVDLTDTFASYTGLGGQYVKVKATEDGLETGSPLSSSLATDHGNLTGLSDDDHTQYVLKSTYNAQTILVATTDDTPVALTVAEQRVVGRLTGGNIDDLNIGIADDNILQVDGADLADDEYCRMTADGIESRSKSEVATDLKDQFPQAITDNHVVTVDSADAADNEYARFTANGLESRTASEVYTDLMAQTLLENDAIKLDVALSADGKYNGITETGTAGATLAFGDCVYQSATDDRWELAKADAEATTKCRLGICVLAAANDGDAVNILLIGKIRADAVFPTFTKYAPVFISKDTAGALTQTAPSGAGEFIRCVGQAISADELWFNPDNVWWENG